VNNLFCLSNKNSRDIALIFARVLLSAIFLFAAIGKLRNHQLILTSMMSHHVPFCSFTYYLAILMELIGGLSILLGFFVREGAMLLFLYTGLITLYYHNFWHLPNPQEYAMQLNLFLKNLAIMGGLLVLSVFYARRWAYKDI
jgi:putative oxidoreductase